VKAWIVDGKFGLDHLSLVDRETPRPKAGEILVRIRAASVNYRDLMVVSGKYAPNQPLPFVPVSDGAGEVAAVGEGVTRWKVGDRVIGTYQQKWIAGRMTAEARDSTLAAPRQGVLSEFAIFDAEGAVAVPEHLSFEEAATLPIAAVTAWHALFVDQPIGAGDTVLVQGTGGVAIFAVQFARAAGANVIVISSSDDKLARAREIGAHEGINYKTTPAWDVRVRELTGGRGVDLVVDVAGGDLGRSINAVRLGGQVSLIGLLDGIPAKFDIVHVLQKNVRLQGISVGSRELFEDMNRAIAKQRLRPVIGKTFAFEKAPEAIAALDGTAYVGKLVIRGA